LVRRFTVQLLLGSKMMIEKVNEDVGIESDRNRVTYYIRDVEFSHQEEVARNTKLITHTKDARYNGTPPPLLRVIINLLRVNCDNLDPVPRIFDNNALSKAEADKLSLISLKLDVSDP